MSRHRPLNILVASFDDPEKEKNTMEERRPEGERVWSKRRTSLCNKAASISCKSKRKKKNSSELLILVPLVAEVHLGASVGCDKTVTEMPIESQSIIQPVLIVSNKSLIRQSK